MKYQGNSGPSFFSHPDHAAVEVSSKSRSRDTSSEKATQLTVQAALT